VKSLILLETARLLTPLLLLTSVLVLLRGHDNPGGGFVGGLLAAAAFTLQAIGRGISSARRALRIDPHQLIGIGLLVAIASGVPALLHGASFMTGQTRTFRAPLMGEFTLSTVLVFDIGVYAVVLGTVLLIVFTLAEE
jgi:multicomponent Na+:H+ antiporter subunit B